MQLRHKTSRDCLSLHDCRITNALRCVPTQNKPIGPETKACGAFLARENRRDAQPQDTACLGNLVARRGAARVGPEKGRLQIRAWRTACAAGRENFYQLVSLFALQYEHRAADGEDVRRHLRRPTRMTRLGIAPPQVTAIVRSAFFSSWFLLIFSRACDGYRYRRCGLFVLSTGIICLIEIG